MKCINGMTLTSYFFYHFRWCMLNLGATNIQIYPQYSDRYKEKCTQYSEITKEEIVLDTFREKYNTSIIIKILFVLLVLKQTFDTNERFTVLLYVISTIINKCKYLNNLFSTW